MPDAFSKKGTGGSDAPNGEGLQLLPPPSHSEQGRRNGGISRQRSRSVGDDEIARENIEVVSAGTALNSTSSSTATASHNMATPTSPPIRGEVTRIIPPTIVQTPPSTYNERVVSYLRQSNIIDILKEKSTAILTHKSLRDKVNMIRQEGCQALERLSCDVELIKLLR